MRHDVGRGARIVSALAVALCAAGPGMAQDRVSILLGSHHVNASFDFEEINPGAFLTWEGDQVDWTVGGFRNSYGGASAAVMLGMPVYERGPAQIALTAGLAVYPGDGRRFAVRAGDVVPLGGIRARYGNAFVQVFPSDGNTTDAIVSFGLTFSLTDAAE
ncbi:hypothetical protein KUD11_10405 [Roseovarius sp. LXJ103]|uniref:hypothetical protein n=1 Tax=Roseovarius carneus TaxID=2853164 RepID=UPI0011B273BC|nr:hypothetical protein [Roseovarius carneus]MBZ8119057.1 hypothetical protein [Roseovarius carneus]